MLKKQVGNMYDFTTHSWRPVKGECSHNCSYCYVKKFGELNPLHIDEKEMKTDLGEGNFIFVCDTVDLFAEDVPREWIDRILNKMREYPKNKYLLQSKNPARFLDFHTKFSKDVVLGTTIETNRTEYGESNAPPPIQRAFQLARLGRNFYRFSTMVTLEPIFDFDLSPLVEMIKMADPEWINIGADSKGHGLPEPSKDKILCLIDELKKQTDVKLKDNLKRLVGDLKEQP